MKYKGSELFDIETLVNDFNFFDISASYIDMASGYTKRGKFRYSELELEKITNEDNLK